MASNAADFLNEVCERLTEGGKTSRDLAALKFDSEIEHFDVLIREEPHVNGYPELADILDELSHACAEHGVAKQARRIISSPSRRLSSPRRASRRPRGVLRHPERGARPTDESSR